MANPNMSVERNSAARGRGMAAAGARLGGLTAPVRDFWSAREPRERKLLAWGLAALLLAALYLLLIDPALTGRAQLRKDLPALRQQVTQMQSMARELEKAPAAADAAQAAPATRESLEASLAPAGLKAQSITVTGEIIRIQMNGVSFAALVGWLEQAAKNSGITVVESSIVAQTQPDTVNATLTLRQQRRE
ncbi:MAG: type secretion system protein [Paucimonas sp.]|nr:type secretion system protein [Paucimonas sp.]